MRTFDGNELTTVGIRIDMRACRVIRVVGGDRGHLQNGILQTQLLALRLIAAVSRIERQMPQELARARVEIRARPNDTTDVHGEPSCISLKVHSFHR